MAQHEIVQLVVDNPYYNFLRKELGSGTVRVDDQEAVRLLIPARHWMAIKIASKYGINPTSLCVILNEGLLKGVIHSRVSSYRNNSLRGMIDNVYKLNFLLYREKLKHGGMRDADIIKGWLEAYDLPDENPNKYVKIILNHSKKSLI